MPRRLRSNLLETRSQRLRLEHRPKPYWFAVAAGIALGYRAGPGSWSVRCADGKGGNWIKSFAIADDHEDADGDHIMNFWSATERAKQLARGKDADAGRPATVDEALEDYAADLAVRRGGAANASRVRFRLTPTLLSKPVSLLTVRELRSWRNDLARKLQASSVNRTCKALKAALNLAASHDDRISNAKAWMIGLAAIAEAADTTSNLVLSDRQRRDIVAAAYAIDPAFGLYVEVHIATGARSGQIAELTVGDLELGTAPLLRMPSSLKGRARRVRTKKPVPITAALARRLQAVVGKRPHSEPLLLRTNGARWSNANHRRSFDKAAMAAGLPESATIYCLRHTAITRALLAGVPVRLVASSFDTSVAMIEQTYSKYIADHGDAHMRRALFDIELPAVEDDKSVPITR